MREYKLRAWYKPLKKMVKVGQITFEKGTWNYESDNREYVGVCIPYQPSFILMQYTGMKDINGTEIYEGDIVKDQYCIYEVVYDGNGYYVKVVRVLKECGTQKGLLYDLSNYEDLEVIGNIYENLELLEKPNE